jgi:oligopeptidase B
MFTAGINDDQVPYWQPAKWTAKLRDIKTDDNVLLLKTNLGAGHGGESERDEAYREVAYLYAFMLMQFGLAA